MTPNGFYFKHETWAFLPFSCGEFLLYPSSRVKLSPCGGHRRIILHRLTRICESDIRRQQARFSPARDFTVHTFAAWWLLRAPHTVSQKSWFFVCQNAPLLPSTEQNSSVESMSVEFVNLQWVLYLHSYGCLRMLAEPLSPFKTIERPEIDIYETMNL